MNRTDLEKLAETLETKVPADRFNMAKWWVRDCGCAIGWGNELGVLPAGLTVGTLVDPWPYMGLEGGFEALAIAYDISVDMAHRLFCDEEYPEDEFPVVTPQHVAARIREVLSGS